MNELNETEEILRKKRQVSPGSHMEVMVYIDQGVDNAANDIGIDTTDYILAIINIVRLALTFTTNNLCMTICFLV